MHGVLACMVVSGFNGKYEQLRNSYNSVIDDGDLGSLRVPLMKEWRGMTSICDHTFCRWAMIRVCVGSPAGRSVFMSQFSEASSSLQLSI